MKYLKMFNKNIKHTKEWYIEKSNIINIMNDLIYLAIDEIDKVEDKYRRSDICVLFVLQHQTDDFIFYAESRNEKYITADDLNFNDNLNNHNFNIDECELTFDIRILKDGSYEEINLNFSEIFLRMDAIYANLKLDIIDPYSW